MGLLRIERGDRGRERSVKKKLWEVCKRGKKRD